MHTAHTDCTEPIRFTYKQMQRRDMLFRYANRHDFIARPSDCSPREPSFFFYPLAASPCHGSLFFVVCIPNQAELLQYRYGNDGCVGGGGDGDCYCCSITAAENLK